MEKRRILFLIISLLCVLKIQAQWDAPFTQFWTVKTYYNPSFAGESDKIQLSGIYKYQWAGIENAPKHIFLSADMPVEFIGRRHGVGILTYSATIGNERNSLFAAQYAFRQKLGKGMFNMAIQAGMHEINFDAASIHLTVDSVKNGRKTLQVNPAKKKTIDINAGISWTTKHFHIGVAAAHINQPAFYALDNTGVSDDSKNDSTYSKIPTSYNFISGYNITLFYPLELQPMFFAQTDLSTTCFQAALRTVYNGKYSAGASWRGKDGYSFFAGFVVEDIEVGYTYDLHRSGIGKDSGGSHELSVRYRFPIDLWNKKPMPRKSIRLL